MEAAGLFLMASAPAAAVAPPPLLVYERNANRCLCLLRSADASVAGFHLAELTAASLCHLPPQ